MEKYIGVIAMILSLSVSSPSDLNSAAVEKDIYKVYPLGKIQKNNDSTLVVIYDEYVNALKGLEKFSHVLVFYWFHENDTPEKRNTLQVYPKGNKSNPLTGVFACRSPARPNLIALSLCKILAIKGNVIKIDHIDAFHNSPVIDIKPYIPNSDMAQEDVKNPKWLRK
jgi:tRNA (adenine37-N6)-methyltransferase